MVQLPRSNRSVCLHRRGRPPGRPGGTSKTQHMLWANSQPPRCESVKGFHACTNVALRIPDSRRAARRKRHIRPSVPPTQCSALRTPFQAAGARAAEGGSPYGGDGRRRSSPPGCPDPTLRRGRDPSSALPPQDDSAARCAGRRGHPEERETRDVPSSAHPHAVTTGTSSVIRLAGDRRMPPSPCAG